MEEMNEEQEYIRKYLLGYLDEEARQVVEERLFTDPAYMEQVLIVESELIEDYSDGMLSERDRERFSKYILTTERQAEKLMLSRALGTYTRVAAAANSPPIAKVITQPLSLKRRFSNLFRTKVWGIQFPAAALILIIFFGLALAIILSIRSSQYNSLSQEVAELNAQENLNPEGISHGYIIGPLRAGLFRDEENINKSAIPNTESIVQLRLQIGAGDYQSFQAVLLTDEGQEILSLSDLKGKEINSERVVIIYLPARVLTPGDYQLKLSGLAPSNQLKDLGRYTFHILSK